MAEPRLTLADQEFVNALAAATVAVVQPREDRDMLMAIVAEVLPQVNRDHPKLATMGRAADELIEALAQPGPPGAAAASSARMFVLSELREFFRWRLGEARETRLRKEAEA